MYNYCIILSLSIICNMLNFNIDLSQLKKSIKILILVYFIYVQNSKYYYMLWE